MDKSQKEVYAFIDSQNLNLTIQNLGWKMDWRKFRRFLSDKYGVTRAFMFIGYMPENEEMYERLHESGYAIVLKPTYDMTRPRPEEGARPEPEKPAEKEEKKIKGNVDAEMVLWAVKEMPNYHKAVIVTGDGDFYSLVEYLEEKGKLLKLLTPSGHYSRLFNRFDKYIERIDQHRRELSYRPAFKKKPADKR
jgi:uncharacterized LabA/DUF88 family protein